MTFGWIALLEVGVLVLDRGRYGASIPPTKLLAAAVIIAL